MAEFELVVVAWLGTFFVHSLILLGGVALALACWRGCPRPWQERLWQAALLGGVLTTSLQLAIGSQPEFGRLALQTSTAPPAKPLVLPNLEVVVSGEVPESEHVLIDDAPAPAAEPIPANLSQVGSRDWSWRTTACGLFGLGVFFATWLQLRGHRRLKRLIADRETACDQRVTSLIKELRVGPGLHQLPQVSVSHSIQSPIAFGLWRQEVCVPGHLVDELPRAGLRAVLAHEVAHLRRRDPLLQTVWRWLSLVFWWQPLHLLAVARLRELAEFDCDATAVRQCGDGLPLAKALLAVAEQHRLSGRRLPLLAPAHAMARHAQLGDRVRSILLTDPQRPRQSRLAPGWLLLAMTPACLALPGLRPWSAVESAITPPAITPPAVEATAVGPLRGAETLPHPASVELVRLEEDLDELAQETRAMRELLQNHPRRTVAEPILRAIEHRIRRLQMRRQQLLKLSPNPKLRGIRR